MIRTANGQFRRNLGLSGGVTDFLTQLAPNLAEGAKIVIRSNVTPEITLDIAQLLKPGTPPATAVKGDSVLMGLIKPEVVVTGLGLEKIMSPYGRPQAGMFMVVALGAGVAAALGGLVAWKICRGSRK